MISNKKLMEMIELSKKATQGDWEYTGNNGVDYECSECGAEFPENGYAVKSKDEYQVLECHLYGMERFCKPDGEFIARANPSTISAIVQELVESRKIIKEFHKHAIELCESEIDKNQIERKRLGIQEGYHLIDGNFRLNRAWRDFSYFELEIQAHLAKWRSEEYAEKINSLE